MKQTLTLLILLTATIQLVAQGIPVLNKNASVPKTGGKGGKGGTTVITIGAGLQKVSNTTTEELEKLFWNNSEVQAMSAKDSTKKPVVNTIRLTLNLGVRYYVTTPQLDPTSGTYVSKDSAGKETKWLAVRFKGTDEKTKKPIELNMLKNLATNIATVWGEDGENNFIVATTGVKPEVKATKLATSTNFRFGRTNIAESDCSGAPCYRCPWPPCIPPPTPDPPKK